MAENFISLLQKEKKVFSFTARLVRKFRHKITCYKSKINVIISKIVWKD